MSDQRLQGTFLWYKIAEGYGRIQGDDGKQYFVSKSSYSETSSLAPGVRVNFLVIAFRESLNAHNIQRDQPTHTAGSQELQTKEALTVSVQQAAQEALRLKRERRDGLIAQPVEDFPPGTRVLHSRYGLCTVLLSSKEILSLQLMYSPGRTVEVRRDEVVKADVGAIKEASVSQTSSDAPRIESAPQPKKTASSLAGFLKEMESDVLQTLTEEGLDPGKIYFYEERADSPFPPQKIEIDGRVAQAFQTVSGITEFYSHQVAARQALLQGDNVIISTPTASGKTEAYNPTILEELIKNPNSTALYLFPLVALGLDQTERLQKLNQALPASDHLEIGIYNGSIPDDEKRRTLNARNRILVTTPESFHYIFLPKPFPNWKNFYRNLRYVVIDEAHLYRGVFGANMAIIIRRLLIRCRHEGNPRFPQIIISSATIRDPAQLAQQLTGLPVNSFEVIVESGAPKPGRHFLVTRSDIQELDNLCGELMDVTTTRHGEDHPRPVSMIVFLRSINEVKNAARSLKTHLRHIGKRDQAALVEAFYAEKTDKVDVLIRLRKGEIRCVFTTSALMAGIDIGSLDVAIVKNFPRLIMDARQMFGRAGRAGDGAVIFIANRKDPFDQFYFEKPELLFEGPTEDVVANPENAILLGSHLLCASQASPGNYKNFEGPLPGEWAYLFGQMGRDLLDNLVALGTLKIKAGNYSFISTQDPHDVEPLDMIRSMTSEMYTLRNEAGEKLEEKRIETAYRDAHLDAIFSIGGESYKVIEFNPAAHEIICTPHQIGQLRTRGVETKNIQIESIDSVGGENPALLQCGITIESGAIMITTRIETYILYKTEPVMQCRKRSCKYETPNFNTPRCPKCNSPLILKIKEEIQDDNIPVPVPPELTRSLKTRAAWLNFPETLRDRYSKEFWPRWSDQPRNNSEAETVLPNFEYAIHSLKHAILKAFPDCIRCDPDEIAGIYFLEVGGYAGRLFIYDNFRGGLGLSDEIPNAARRILERALDLIERCNCIDDQGCPVCLAYFGCHDFNKSISKLAGRYLIRVLLGESTQEVLKDLKEYVDYNVP